MPIVEINEYLFIICSDDEDGWFVRATMTRAECIDIRLRKNRACTGFVIIVLQWPRYVMRRKFDDDTAKR